MTSQIKITQLSDIGNNIANTTLVPVVNMTGVSTTQKATMGNIANSILAGAGTAYQNANIANIALSVANAAQPNITSVGTLSVNTLKISGGSADQVLSTDGAGNLSWVAQSGGGGNTGNVTFNDVNIIGDGNLYLQPNPSNTDAYLDVYLTSGPDIHIAGNGENLILGRDEGANIVVGVDGNVSVRADSGSPQTWLFDTDGNTTFPDGTVIQGDGSGIYYPTNDGWNLHRPDNLVWIGSGTNVAYIDTYSPNVSVRIRTLGDPQDVLGYDWIFDPTGNLTLPGNTFSVNYANGQQVQLGGGNANTGNIGFDDNVIYSLTGVVVNNSDLANGQTAGIDIPANGDGNAVSLYNTYGNINIQAGNIGNSQSVQTWVFGADGNLSLPNGTRISNKETNLIKGPALNSFGSNSYTGIFTTLNYTGLDTTWVVNGPGVSNGVIQSIDAAGQTIILDRNSGGPQFQDGENYTFTGPLVSIGTDITVNGNSWNFGTNGLLTIPTGAKIGGGGGGVFATDNTVTTSLDLRDTSGRGFYTNTDGYTLRSSGSKNWIFDTAGNLRTPGNVDIYGAINFPQQVSSINWSTYNIELSQYGRINTNVDFFANANVIGAQYLKGDGSNISNIAGANVSGQVGNALVAGTIYTNAQPNITSVGTLSSLSVTGNVSANNFIGNGSQLTGIPTQTTGSWTLTPGVNTVSLTVPINGTYSIWVRGNIPSGIVSYTATVVVTNTNVPVLGSSYGWYYVDGNNLVLTAIPTQIIGTVNGISTATVSTTTANVFTFGITNNSGANAVVNWGYTKL